MGREAVSDGIGGAQGVHLQCMWRHLRNGIFVCPEGPRPLSVVPFRRYSAAQGIGFGRGRETVLSAQGFFAQVTRRVHVRWAPQALTVFT